MHLIVSIMLNLPITMFLYSITSYQKSSQIISKLIRYFVSFYTLIKRGIKKCECIKLAHITGIITHPVYTNHVRLQSLLS